MIQLRQGLFEIAFWLALALLTPAGLMAAADPWVVQTPRADGEVVVRRQAGDQIGAGDRVEFFFVIEAINERARKATGEVVGVDSDAFTVRIEPDSLSGPIAAGDKVAVIERAPPERSADPSDPAEPGYVGVSVGDSQVGGVPILGVAPGGPAEQAGIAAGDSITRLRGLPFGGAEEFKRIVRETTPGTALKMSGLRNGVPREFAVRIRPWPEAVPPMPIPQVPAVAQAQLYVPVRDYDGFKEQMLERWKTGHASTSIAYGEGGWLATATTGTMATDQIYLGAGDFDYVRTKFTENAANGFALTCVDCIGGTWIATFTKGLPFTGQTWKAKTTPDGIVSEAKALAPEGYAITAITHGKNSWFAVFSKGTGYASQAIAVLNGVGDIRKTADEWWNKGYRITSASSYGGVWILVFSEGSGYTMQAWTTCATFSQAADFIKQKWDEGMLITNVARGRGAWLVVMSKGRVRW